MTATPDDKLCARCRHSRGAPVMCTLHTRDGAPRLAVPLRASAGPCGPEGAFFEASAAVKTMATVLKFPTPHRVSA